MRNQEYGRLNRISEQFNYSQGINGLMIEYLTTKTIRFLKPGSVLELGPAEGASTVILAKYISELEVVDASKKNIRKIKQFLPNVKCHHSLFENFRTSTRFNNIILGHVLEHVQSPELIVSKCLEWLKPQGRVIVSVPNADSFHREIGVVLGLIGSKKELNPSDLLIGHRRVFDRQELETLFLENKFKIIESSGFFLKTMSNSQIEQNWNESVIRLLMRLGEEIPGKAAELFLVADARV